jgi:glutaredoxin
MGVVIYVKPRCPYCAAARKDFKTRGEPFEERDATADPDWREELMRYTDQTGLVPTIVRTGEAEEVQVGFPPGQG